MLLRLYILFEMKLSKNFTLEEFIRSSTAESMGIDNVPKDEEVIENMKALCLEVLQPLRDYVGAPIHINSGYRCKALNEALDGVKGSQHLSGQAADIHVENTEHLLKMMHFIMDETDFDQLIWEKNKAGVQWLHVSHKRNGNNRHQVLKN